MSKQVRGWKFAGKQVPAIVPRVINPRSQHRAFSPVSTDCAGLYKPAGPISQGGTIRLTFPDTVLIYWVMHGTNFYGSRLTALDLCVFQSEHIKFYGIQKGGGIMANSSDASKCCSMEKKKLMAELEKCNFCSDDYEAFHDCYRQAARESGQRSRACIIS